MARPGPKWVAYVGPFKFPAGDAAAKRVAGVATSIAAGGRSVVVANGGYGSETYACNSLPEGVSHIQLTDSPGYLSGRLEKARLMLFDWGRHTVSWLDSQPTPPSHVILYGGLAPFAVHIRKWCLSHNVAFIVDVVEWYAPRQLTGGLPGVLSLSSETAMRLIYPKADGLICISHYLATYYSPDVQHVTIVPPTLSQTLPEKARSQITDPSLKLLYFGNAGRKDRVDLMVRAVSDLRTRGQKLSLTLVGDIPKDLPGGDGIHVLGRVPQSAVAQLVEDHDFSLIVRDSARFTNAGFPTKFVESLAHGTPVIANKTSDLAKHISDGFDGLVVPGATLDSLRATIVRAVLMGTERRHEMGREAKRRALTDFHYSRFIEPLDDLLERTAR